MAKTLTINGHLVRSVALIPGGDVKRIGDGTQTLWEASQPDYFFIENYTQSANTVAFPKTGDAEEWVSLDYSLDGRTWYPYDLETGVSIPAGGKLYLKGDNANLSKSASSVWTTHSFTSTGAILAGGNAVSLLDSTAPSTKSVGQFGFACMFAGNTNLLSVDSTMFDGVGMAASYVFYKTFDGCTNLTNVPVFRGVTNVTQSSFTQTFRNCSSVTTAAGFLPNAVSTTSALVFQSCFVNCTGLVTPPDLSAIVPGAGNSVFIEMFRGCTSLATPAEVYSPFPDVTGTHKLAGMYNGCTSLTRSPRVYIPNPTANILLNTFTGCGSLDLIRVTFDSWGTGGEYTNEWTYGVHSTGVFCKTSSLPVTRNARDAAQSACDYIPYLWSIADQNGKLYAPVITESNGMISIAEAEGGQSCTIYYTTDGADPDPNASVYTQPFAAVPGQTVKAISVYGGASAAYVVHSNITEYTVEDTITYYGYVHESTLSNQTDNKAHIVGTGVVWDDPSVKFRVKGMTKGYQNGGITVGHYGVPDSTRARVESKAIRCFMHGRNGYYDFQGDRNPNYSGVDFTYTDGRVYDITCDNYGVYDNTTGAYMWQGTPKNTIVEPSAEIFFDVGCWWIKSLQIWRNDVLVFDGVAATDGVSTGLYDRVSGTIKTRSGLTIVGEPDVVSAPSVTRDGVNIVITQTSFGTTYYTTDGSEPTAASTQYTQPFASPAPGSVVKAVTIDGSASSSVTSYTVTSTVLNAPSIFRYQNNVVISQNNQSWTSASIHYTTDGSTPTADSTLYTGAISAVLGQTVKAICHSENSLCTDSSVATFTVTTSQLSSPTISRSENNVVITHSNESWKSATIRYTTDGSTPTAESPAYTGAIPAVLGQTVKAICTSSLDLYTASGTASLTVTAVKMAAPVCGYANSLVTIRDNNPAYMGSSVYYTTDGSTPDSTSTLYTQPFAASVGDTVKAVCLTSNNLYTASDVKTYTVPSGGLPQNTFMFNYNAKEYDSSSRTFPKASGQLFNRDLVLNYSPSADHSSDGYVTMNGRSYMDVKFTRNSDNVFNRQNTAEGRTLTLVFKVAWTGSGGSEAAFLGNRGSSQSDSGNTWNYMMRYNLFHVTNGPSIQAQGSSPLVFYVRVNSDATCIYKCETTGVYSEASGVSYGNPSGNFTFFGDSNFANSTSFHFQGSFYWMYLSHEALTDAEIQQVIDYNESL